MMYSNVIIGITISRGLFVFSQSRGTVSASLTNIGSLAVGAFDTNTIHLTSEDNFRSGCLNVSHQQQFFFRTTLTQTIKLYELSEIVLIGTVYLACV